jgi:two-component system nitrogen regulation response regulator GlnG
MDIKTQVLELEKELFVEKEGVLYRSILQIVEKPLIENILERTYGNQIKAARILGLNRNTLRTKIKRLGINIEKWKNT